MSTRWWWISFVDSSLPEGSQFLGVAIVDVSEYRQHIRGNVVAALTRAWELGINPGGEAQAILIPEEHVPAEQYRRKLLSREEIKEAGL